MRDTLPFAPVALRELAAFWQKQLSELDGTSDRGDLRTRLAQLYVQILNTDPDPAVQSDAADRVLSLHDAEPIDTSILEKVAEIAKELDETDLQRRVLERLAICEDAAASTSAREQLGEIFERTGNRSAAVASWRSAAQLWESAPGEQEHARWLYERVLETAPDDGEAAGRLVRLYAARQEWNKVPELMGVVLRTDSDRGSELLLELVPHVVDDGARDKLVSMIDEAIAWLRASSPWVPGLLRAKAHALAAVPARYPEACEAFRTLMDTVGSEDDLRHYESFITALPHAGEQRDERRWLYEWRAAREKQPAGVLLAWAEEEEGHGEAEAALVIYRRLVPIAPEADRPAVVLRIARLLAQLGLPAEAMTALGPVFALAPPFEPGYEMARELLADRASVEPLERIASVSNGVIAGRLFGLLVDARSETAGMPEARRRWLRRIVELRASATTAGLSAIVQGAIDFPDEVVLWQAAERIAREVGQLDLVVHAYGEVIARGTPGPALADALGRRVVALEGDCNVEPSFFVEVLQGVLELAPSARWSFDRVKLALGSQARWEDLFRVYDRAIHATVDEGERAELLEEAALAARDLASDADRATGYFASLHALRPDDAAASVALERLYERQGKRGDLVELLAERAGRSDGVARQQVQHRIAALRLDLGQVGEASAVVDAMLDEGAPVADVATLLEGLALHAGQERVIERLCAHYESVGRIDAAANLAKEALERAENADERARRVRDLVRFRVSAAQGSPGVFARVMASFDAEVADKPALAQHVYRAVLLSAMAAWKQAPDDADFRDAADGAWRAIEALKSALVNAGNKRSACRLLERSARLPFEPGRRRELLEQAVQLCTNSPGDGKQAIRLYTGILEAFGPHAFAVASLDHFAGLLEAAGENAQLARLLEQQTEPRVVSFEALARVYLAGSQWDDAVRVLEWLCAHTTESAREKHVLRLADAYVGVGRLDRARSCLEGELRSAPAGATADEMRTRLLALYRRDSAWEPLARMLSDEGRRSESLLQKVALLREAAAVLEDKLDQVEEAAAVLELAVAADPRDPSLRLELARLLERLGQWPRAAAALKDCIAMCGDASPKERALLHQRMARALGRSEDLEGALAHLRAAAAMQPTNPLILNDLGRVALEARLLDVAASAYRTLLLSLRNPVEQGAAISRSHVILSLGRIALLKGDPRHAAGLFDTALDEALDSGEDPEAFEQALREVGREDLVARALELRIERTPSLSARTVALRKLVDLWIGKRGRDPELGSRIRHYTETILRELGEQRSAGGAAWSGLSSVLARLDEAALQAMLGGLQQNERLEPLLQKAIATMEPGVDRARLLLLLARTQIAKAGPGEGANALLSGALDDVRVGQDAPGFVDTACALGNALELAERRDDAMRLYESILDRRSIPVETVRLIAGRLEALGSPRLADCHELWISLDPEAARALAQRLVDLRAAQGDAEGLVRALELGLTADPTNRFSDLLRIGSKEARSQAQRALDRLLERNPQHAGALEGMAALSAGEGAWDRAEDAYGRLLPIVAGRDPVEATHLQEVALALADACERAGRPGAAREPLQSVLRILPDDARLAGRLEQLCEASGDYERLVGLIAARAERTADGPQKAALLLRAANLLIERAGAPARARPFIERARSACPDSIEAGLAWVRAHSDLGQPSEALPVLLEIVARNRGKRLPAIAGIYLEIGKAHLAADDLVEAFDALKAGFAIDPRSSELAVLLGLLAIDLDDDRTAERALVSVATARTRHAVSGDRTAAADRVTAMYQLAAMAESKGDVAKGLRWATTAVREDPGHAGARALLEKLEARPADPRTNLRRG
jgi:tetratricopeptide (TPR) repeat protein